MAAAQSNNGGDLGFEAELFKAADKLRGNLEPSEYKHVALGLIFLKYISEAFEAQHAKLQATPYADPEDLHIGPLDGLHGVVDQPANVALAFASRRDVDERDLGPLGVGLESTLR